MTREHPPTLVLTRERLHELVPLSRTHIARLEKAGLFPRRIKLGARRVGWISAEVEAWLRRKADERDISDTSCNEH